MKLSKLAMGILKDRKIKQRVAELGGVSENTVYAWIKTESDNLTKASIVGFLMTEYGLTYEQVLEVEQVAA